MLTNADYLELLLQNPKPEETFFYHDRAILYALAHKGEKYMISLVDEDEDKQTETFLLVRYLEPTYSFLVQNLITPREFFTHPYNTVYHALLEYTEGEPVILLADKYEDNLTIPDAYLPTADARWN